MLEVKVSGLDELRDTLLNQLGPRLQGRALTAALRVAARPITKTARRLAPQDNFVGPRRPGDPSPGTLKRSIYVARRPGGAPTRQAVIIGVRSGKRHQKTGKDAYYWKWIEFGRAAIVRKGPGSLGTPSSGFFGHEVRAMPARPFMRPAFEANKTAALEAFRKEILGVIKKVSAKAAARADRRMRRLGA